MPIRITYRGGLRGLRNLALVLVWQRVGRGRFFVSAEDLTAPPVVTLQQSLVLAAMLDLDQQERNGHHYTRGLGMLTLVEREEALRTHPDLYTAEGGFARLRVRDGAIQIGSLLRQPGLAVAREPPWFALTPLEQWTPDSLNPEAGKPKRRLW